MSKNNKYYFITYTSEIIFKGDILSDKDVILRPKEKIIYHKYSREKFVKKYMNELWFKQIIDNHCKIFLKQAEKIVAEANNELQNRKG